MKNMEFKELKELYLSNNKIININSLENIQFKPDCFYLDGNPFDKLNNSSTINCLKMKIKDVHI